MLKPLFLCICWPQGKAKYQQLSLQIFYITPTVKSAENRSGF